MSLDITQPLRIYAAVRRRSPWPGHQLELTVTAARDKRLSWTAVGLLAYLSTQMSDVIGYGLPAFAGRGGIAVEQLGAAVAELRTA